MGTNLAHPCWWEYMECEPRLPEVKCIKSLKEEKRARVGIKGDGNLEADTES